MTRTPLLLCLALIFSLPITARVADKITIQGSVYDKASDTQLFVADARLLDAKDSTIIATTKAVGEFDGAVKGTFVRKPVFIFPDVDRNKKYILQLTRQDYEPLYIEINPATISNRLDNLNLGKIYMTRTTKMLNEVVVKASKIVFYNKGDTVIYNADAFVLAEGSMLDALIRQMPGVELKDGGAIYVNGRYVENLLLNGKDFFRDNRQMMLENLGAYTVKDIAVFDRQDDMDKIMGEDYGSRHLTMDVRLKKEYNQGVLSNIEAGYGTNDRYLGRMFGLWYSDNARLSLYGNINNLSDNRKPGQDTGFTPASLQSGDFKTYQGGVDYWAKIPYKDVSFYGDIMATHQTIDDDRTILTTNFLPGADTYQYSYATSRNKSLSLSTSHSLDIQKEKWNFKLSPGFKYSKNNDLSALTSATFSKELAYAGKDFLDNLYNGTFTEVLASILNRYKDDNKRLGHRVDAAMTANGKIKMHNDADAVTCLVSANYNRQHLDKTQRYVLNFGSNPTPADFFDRYFDDTPNYELAAKGALGYIWAIRPGMFLDSWYEYRHNYRHEVSDLYRFENMDTPLEEQSLGWLPSKMEYDYTLDIDNSYISSTTENHHSINFKWTWWATGKLYFALNMPVVFRNQHLHYMRGNLNTSFSRNKTFIGNASLDINYLGRPHRLYFTYNRHVYSPNLVDMVEFRDSLDPLNVRLGNPGLNDSESHNFSLSYRKDSKKYQSYRLYATIWRNALGYGYGYDSSTGVKTGKMYNINGNYMLRLSQYFSFGFGTIEQFNFGNTTTLDYRHSVDFISENTVTPVKNKVGNLLFSENLELSYKFGSNKITLNGEGRLSHFTSRQINFKDFTACDFRYCIRGDFSLPIGFGISTDFSVYTRRGYSDSLLNKTNFVWNARASYTMLKGQLTLMIDGFDILHNLSNVFYNVNAQARTETYTNVLPRYVMFHAQWKFHKAPKKK
ncbi:MAG: outer membrane beta-barrel family protein [Muribaculaceae bacterium]